MPGWWNWYTQETQNLPASRPWGFESLSGHQNTIQNTRFSSIFFVLPYNRIYITHPYMNLYIWTDHYWVELAQKIEKYVDKHTSYTPVLIGSKTSDEKIDLPDFILPVCEKVVAEKPFWVLICGTGAWVVIGANKRKWVRATLCRKEIDAKWAREKDDANVLCLAGWDTSDEELEKILKNWFETSFDNPKILNSLEIMDNWR